VFVGGLQRGRPGGTGRLERIVFNTRAEEIRRESLLTELRKRVRDVRQGPDGLLYVIVEDDVDRATGGETALLRTESCQGVDSPDRLMPTRRLSWRVGTRLLRGMPRWPPRAR
jgi:hypothetical protein